MRKKPKVPKRTIVSLPKIKNQIVTDIIDQLDDVIGNLDGYNKFDLTGQIVNGEVTLNPAPIKSTLILAHDGMVMREGFDFEFITSSRIKLTCHPNDDSYLIAYYRESLEEKLTKKS